MFTSNENERNGVEGHSDRVQDLVEETLQSGVDDGEPSYNEPVNSQHTSNEPVDVPPECSALESNLNNPTSQNATEQNAENSHEPDQAINAYASPMGRSPDYSNFNKNEQYAIYPSKPKKKKSTGFLKAACLILACAIFSAAAAYVVMEIRYQRGDFDLTREVVFGSARPDRNPTTAPVAINQSDFMTAQEIYEMALSQVVVIQTQVPTRGFFGEAFDEAGSSPVSGSGFIISSDGYILTNYHVIEAARVNDLPISVIMEDGTEFTAEIIGFEESNDVALIKIDATGLNAAVLGNSDEIQVGERIYAVGNPFGDLVYTMTDGIISALDRVVSVDSITINAFQFSAAVNRGNSGGPIYNSRGEVIGIVTAKVIRGNVEGIGFAVPINDALNIATALIEDGYISGRPLLGVTVRNITPDQVISENLIQGILVLTINPGAAADNAGVRANDIIISLGGESVASINDLRNVLSNFSAGDTAKVELWRDGATFEVDITFDEDMYAGRPDRPAVIVPEENQQEDQPETEETP